MTARRLAGLLGTTALHTTLARFTAEPKHPDPGPGRLAAPKAPAASHPTA